MLAVRRANVALLNQLTREQLLATGQLVDRAQLEAAANMAQRDS